MKTLISMTEFVLSYKYNNENPIYNQHSGKVRCIDNYANFLNTPLKLGMFIPCDENDKPLENPHLKSEIYSHETMGEHAWKADNFIYKEAQEKVLFENCKIEDGELIINEDYVFHYGEDEHGFYLESEYPHTSIECLAHLQDIKLTQSALTTIGI